MEKRENCHQKNQKKKTRLVFSFRYVCITGEFYLAQAITQNFLPLLLQFGLDDLLRAG